MNEPASGFWTRARRFFLQGGVWRIDERPLRWPLRQGIRVVRFCWSVATAFKNHSGQLHASALTYYTLFAIVPMLALGLALARVFGGEQIARREMHKQLDAWLGQMPAAQAHPSLSTLPATLPPGVQPPPATCPPESATQEGPLAVPPPAAPDRQPAENFRQRFVELEDKLFSQIDRLGLGTLGGIGVIGLLWMVIGMLGRVETSFNTVWGVVHGRNLWRRFTDYLTVVMIVPFLAVAASTVPVMDLVTKHAAAAGVSAGSIQAVAGLVLFKRAIVLLLATLAFTCLLVFMPNTRVRFVPGLIGGIFTAVAFTAWLKVCTLMQLNIAKYSILYGSFAVLPILLAWVYVSWEIMLIGAEVTCAIQYSAAVSPDRSQRASPRSRLLLALALCAQAARAMRERGAPFDAHRFVVEHRLPIRLSQLLLADLVSAGLLAEVRHHPGRYLPCIEPEKLTVADVTRCILDRGLAPEDLGLHRLNEGILAAGIELDRGLDQVLGRPVAP